MVRDNPVDLLWHGSVKTPETCLDMADPDVEFGGCKSPGHDGVGVALDEDDVGRLLHQDILDPGQDPGGLAGLGSGADIEVVLRLGEIQVLEERPVHLVGVVLAGVKDKIIDVSALAFPDDRGHLDDFWPCPKNDTYHSKPTTIIIKI